MKIGITFDLKQVYLEAGYSPEEVAELDEPTTVDAIARALAALGHRPDPIGGLAELWARLARGERWDLVFNIAEGLVGSGREALVPALLEAHGLAYTFSDPATLAVCLHKALAKRVVRDAGIPTPDFALVVEPEDVESVALDYPLFAKPAAEGSSKGISGASLVANASELRAICGRLLERYRQPVLVERYLPGRELTVGLLGTGREARVLAVMEVLIGPGAEPGGYTYRNKTVWEGIVSQRLVEEEDLAREAGAIALAAWRVLGGRDAGRVDLKLDAGGRVQFLEANPLAGLAPGASDLTLMCGLLGVGYEDLIESIVESAAARVVGLLPAAVETAR